MDRRWMTVAVPLIGVLACGCYGAKLLRSPVAVDNTEQRTAALSEQQAILQDQVKKLQESLARQEEMIRSLRADTQTRLKELDENLQSFSNRINDSLSRRSQFTPAVPYSTAPPMASEGVAAAAPDSAGAQAALTPTQVKAIYDAAYLDLKRGNYSLALLGFQDYLGKSPESDLADNAQYWIGETYYAQRDFRKAIEEFSSVEQTYPNGDKVPAALLKIAYSYLQIEDRAAARTVLRDLVDRFSKTEEASEARSKLRSLE